MVKQLVEAIEDATDEGTELVVAASGPASSRGGRRRRISQTAGRTIERDVLPKRSLMSVCSLRLTRVGGCEDGGERLDHRRLADAWRALEEVRLLELQRATSRRMLTAAVKAVDAGGWICPATVYGAMPMVAPVMTGMGR